MAYNPANYRDPVLRARHHENIARYEERKRLGLVGKVKPPLIDAYRCVYVKRDGVRCKNYAMVGGRRCRYHGGLLGKARELSMAGITPYDRFLGRTLLDRVTEFVGSASHKEQLQLYGEIAIARATLSESLALAAAAFDSPKCTAEAKLAAAGLVQQGLELVASLCERMARMEQGMDDKVSVRQIAAFTEQITSVVSRVLAENGVAPEVSGKIAVAVREQVRVPTENLKIVRVRTSPGEATR